MAYDEVLANKVRKALSSSNVQEKKGFGGLMFMLNGKMCVSVNNRPDHIMMVRMDRRNQIEALKRKGAKIAVMRGKELNGWIFLTKEAVEIPKDLNYWLRLAIEFNKI